MEKLTAHTDLDKFIQLLREHDFTVIVFSYGESLPEWIHFWKDGMLGYCDIDRFGRANFGTTHKPSKHHGTGFSYKTYTELTLENAEQTITYHGNTYQLRGGEGKIAPVNRYSTIQDYLDSLEKQRAKNIKVLEPKKNSD